MSPNVMLKRCQILVVALVGKQNACKWWTSSNRAFDNITPEQMSKQDLNRVYDYLMPHGSGDYQ
jgi:hypothetical protein